jgi:hypothetical protein
MFDNPTLLLTFTNLVYYTCTQIQCSAKIEPAYLLIKYIAE